MLCLGTTIVCVKIGVDSQPLTQQEEKKTKNKNSEEEDSTFSQVQYFMVKDEAPFLNLSSQELRTDTYFTVTAFLFPMGTVFTNKGIPVRFNADNGSYNKRTESMLLNGQVYIHDEESQITSDRAHYASKEGKFELFGGVKSKSLSKENGDQLFIDSHEGVFWPKKKVGQYQGEVKGELIRKRAYEPGIKFSADRLWADLVISEVVLDGRVMLKRENLEAESLKAIILLENYNKKLKYYTLYDDVKIVEKVHKRSGGYSVRRAFGEKLEGYMSERKVILSGSPKVVQGKDIVKGNRITLLENNELIEVDDSNSRFVIKKKDE